MCDVMTVAVYLPGDPTHTAAATVCPEQHSSNCLFDRGKCGQEMLAACSECWCVAYRSSPAESKVVYEYDNRDRVVLHSVFSYETIGVCSTPTNKPEWMRVLLSSTHAQCISR